MKRLKYYLLSIVIPLVIFLGICTISNIVPLGDYVFNYADSHNMYPALLKYATKGVNYFYSLALGLGTDFYNIRTLYMNSPLNLLFNLFNDKDIFSFYSILIYLRVGLSGLSFSIYLNYLDNKKYSIKNIIFSSLYALSTYAIACSVHIMWMDSYILLPLIILGLDKLIVESKVHLYIIFLSSAIIINYYIGFMICIFCLLYFIYKSYISSNLNFKCIRRFIIASLLSGLISSFVLIPAIFSLLSGRANEFEFGRLLGISRFTFVSLVYNLFPGSYMKVDNYMDGSALIYVSLFIFVLNLLFYFSKNISRKEKIATLVFTIFFAISLFVNFIDYTWNMFQEPVWWSHRYAFVIVFFEIIIGYKSFINIDSVEISKLKKLVILVIVMVLLLGSFSFKTMGLFLNDYYVIILFISLIFFVVYFYFFHYQKFRKFFIFLLIIEVVTNGVLILNINKFITLEDANKYANKNSTIEKIKENENSFFRLIKSDGRMNDAVLYDYNGVSLFSSIYSNSIRDFLINKVGMFSDRINVVNIEYNNPAVTPLLNLKYFVKDDDVRVDENILSLGFAVDNKLDSVKLNDNEYFENINKIYSSLLNEDVNLFFKIETINKTIKEVVKENVGFLSINNMDAIDEKFEVKYYDATYEFKIEKSGLLLFYDCLLINDYLNIEINGDTYDNDMLNGNVKVNKGDEIIVKYQIPEDEYYNKKYNIAFDRNYFVILDDVLLKEYLNKLKGIDMLYDVSTNNNILDANINCTKDETLIISIPYNDSFKVYVDDEKVDYYSVFDTFIGIDMKKGSHKIIIKYLPKGLILGSVVSVVGLLFSVLYIKFSKKESNL